MREEISIQSRVALFLSWASVAIEHEHIAHQARAGNVVTGMRTWDAGASPESRNLRHEFDASLVTITAAALVIDALYGGLRDMLPSRDHKRASRQMRIFETLKAGFRLGKATNEWPPRLEWLFDLRDQGVHFRERWRKLASHPSGTKTTPESALFCAEQASRATDFMLEVLALCVKSPRTTNMKILEWAGWMKGSVEQVEEQRQKFREERSTQAEVWQ